MLSCLMAVAMQVAFKGIRIQYKRIKARLSNADCCLVKVCVVGVIDQLV